MGEDNPLLTGNGGEPPRPADTPSKRGECCGYDGGEEEPEEGGDGGGEEEEDEEGDSLLDVYFSETPPIEELYAEAADVSFGLLRAAIESGTLVEGRGERGCGGIDTVEESLEGKGEGGTEVDASVGVSIAEPSSLRQSMATAMAIDPTCKSNSAKSDSVLRCLLQGCGCDAATVARALASSSMGGSELLPPPLPPMIQRYFPESSCDPQTQIYVKKHFNGLLLIGLGEDHPVVVAGRRASCPSYHTGSCPRGGDCGRMRVASVEYVFEAPMAATWASARTAYTNACALRKGVVFARFQMVSAAANNDDVAAVAAAAAASGKEEEPRETGGVNGDPNGPGQGGGPPRFRL
eukprot:GHVU01011787.1.p2 GENE.GHVU01011787.1~~GHVU01011787.1.p2  ORF type:complete len:350 (+),score=68.70 GHVU01011787.1:3138-4187(+)